VFVIKADGIENISSNALINGCFELYGHLALLFNVTILHGVSPNSILLSKLVPILKNRKQYLNYIKMTWQLPWLAQFTR